MQEAKNGAFIDKVFRWIVPIVAAAGAWMGSYFSTLGDIRVIEQNVKHVSEKVDELRTFSGRTRDMADAGILSRQNLELLLRQLAERVDKLDRRP